MECCCQARVPLKQSRCGCHLPMQPTLLQTLQQASCPCVQTFLAAETSYVCPTLSEEDRQASRAYCDLHDRTFYVHAPLVLFSNLSSPDIVTKSQRVITEELHQIRDLPGACVVHMGKKGTVEMLTEYLNDVVMSPGTHPRMPRQLLLECAAGQGTELGRTWEELRHLYEALDVRGIGLCLDTQHLFAAGMCRFDSVESVVRLFDAAEDVCPKSLRLIHLNDSKKPFGSRVDRHESLGKGYIWSESQESLRALVSRCREDQVDVVLETPTPVEDLKVIQRL
jgi:deoxyribonuclease-4